MLSMSHDNGKRDLATEDVYEPHPSGIGRILIARSGQQLPAGYKVTPVTVDAGPKIENKKVRKAPATKRQTPSETKD